jgi:hypothetical protein
MRVAARRLSAPRPAGTWSSRALLGAATLASVTMAATACASPAAQLTAAARPSATASPATRPTPSNKQRAEQDAAAILAAFVAPSGAHRLDAAPVAALKVPSQVPVTPDLTDKAGWWRVAGDPQQVLSRAAKLVPHRFTLDGEGTESQGGVTTWEDAFDLAPVPGVLDSRQLTIEVAAAGGGQTGIRVDAQVTWLPERTPGQTIPSGVTAATITLDPDTNVRVAPPKPVAVTDPAKVAALIALINGLPPFPAGTYNCPFDGGAQLVLTFRAGPGDPAAAVAAVTLEGCQGVGLTVGGKQRPDLGAVDGGRQVAAQALKLAGLNWSLSRYLTQS